MFEATKWIVKFNVDGGRGNLSLMVEWLQMEGEILLQTFWLIMGLALTQWQRCKLYMRWLKVVFKTATING